jgi:hypothetical protein
VNIRSIMRGPQQARTADCGTPAGRSGVGVGLILLSLAEVNLFVLRRGYQGSRSEGREPFNLMPFHHLGVAEYTISLSTA